MDHITVIGTGYVGLVQGVVLAEFGMDVICMDVDEKKIQKLKQGIVPIYEPDLQELLEKNMKKGRLTFTSDIKLAVEQSEVLFIAVGTPPKEDGGADLKYVKEVAEKIGTYLNSYKVVVNKSTVPVGTGQLVKKTIQDVLNKRECSFTFDVVSNPEFLREGKAIKDCLQPDRVVIGAESEKAVNYMRRVYDVLYINHTPMVNTTIETAEMIKYAANAFLAVKISYINEMALLAEKMGADIQVIAKAMGMDGRISPKFLHAGPGYGGSCFPKDTRAIVDIGKKNGEDMMVINAAIEANEKQKRRTAEKIIKIMSECGDLNDMTVAVWGLSFKPETDDMREAPALDIIKLLVASGLRLKAYCPQGITEAKWRLKDYEESITYCADEYDAVKKADALVVMTEWNQFRGINLNRVKTQMKGELLFDLRNIYKEHTIAGLGFRYFGTGR